MRNNDIRNITKGQKRLFWSNITIGDKGVCWDWRKSKSHNGYGQVKITANGNSKMWRTHRVAWALTNGGIPDNFYVLHHCDNRSCCNPNHLFIGTAQDNANDCKSRGRHRSVSGEKHYAAVLTEDDVRAIKFKYSELTAPQIIKRLNLSCKAGTVNAITRGERWGHIL